MGRRGQAETAEFVDYGVARFAAPKVFAVRESQTSDAAAELSEDHSVPDERDENHENEAHQRPQKRLVLHEAERLHLVAQSVPADAEELRGAGLVSTRAFQGLLHQLDLHVAQGDARVRESYARGVRRGG